MRIEIVGGRVLLGDTFENALIRIEDGMIAGIDAPRSHGGCRIDARDFKVLPGIVDIHGDAFERQMMPRPGVDFPIDVALMDSDRQAIANGITTVFHGTTWSWEPGLRSADNAKALRDAIIEMRPTLAADTRFHLRHETYNLDAEETLIQWIGDGSIDLLAFNDHMASIQKPRNRTQMIARSGLTGDAFDTLASGVAGRAEEVPASIARLAEAARRANVRMLSHDDASPAMRSAYRAQGVAIAEFPINEETARAAAEAEDFIVFGAPNVVRGGSHTGWTKASDMIAKGLCSVLASDYYYPAPLLAAFRLAEDRVLPLAQAWKLVAEAPARATGLDDRGTIAPGQRADIIIVDDSVALRPRVVAVIAAGRLVHLTEAERLGLPAHAAHVTAAA